MTPGVALIVWCDRKGAARLANKIASLVVGRIEALGLRVALDKTKALFFYEYGYYQLVDAASAFGRFFLNWVEPASQQDGSTRGLFGRWCCIVHRCGWLLHGS